MTGKEKTAPGISRGGQLLEDVFLRMIAVRVLRKIE